MAAHEKRRGELTDEPKDVASRLTAAIRRGHRFQIDLTHSPDNCGCPVCLEGDAMLADLMQPATRDATEKLLRMAREYRQHLITVFDAACERAPATVDGEAARMACHRLADELGVTLTDQVRRMLFRECRDGRKCPWCSSFTH